MPHLRWYALRARRVGAPLGVIILLSVVTGLILLLLTAANPTGTAYGFVLSSAAMLVVLGAYRWLDRFEPEPRPLLQLAFLWGASVAVLLAVGLESVGESMSSTLGATPLVSKSFDQAAIQAPFIEEAAKGLFLLVMMTGRRRNELDSLTDCMVYAGVTAVGFAWMEDIVYLASASSPAALAAVAMLRLVFAPFAHPLFTTMTGIGVYVALRRHGGFGKATKATAVLLGYLAAVGMHGLWNASSTVGDGRYFAATYLFWMVPVFVLAIVLATVSRRREQRLVTAKLPGMVVDGLITANEATWLGSLRGRRRAIRAARHAAGRAAGRRVRTFAVAAVELAFVRDRIDRSPGPGVDTGVAALYYDGERQLAAARWALMRL